MRKHAIERLASAIHAAWNENEVPVDAGQRAEQRIVRRNNEKVFTLYGRKDRQDVAETRMVGRNQQRPNMRKKLSAMDLKFADKLRQHFACGRTHPFSAKRASNRAISSEIWRAAG